MVGQGDIINLDNLDFPCIVISKNTYNESGHAIVCPILKNDESLLSYRVDVGPVCGYVQCDNVRMLDLTARTYFTKASASMADLLGILSMTTSVLELI